jgi:hypothetical protein
MLRKRLLEKRHECWRTALAGDPAWEKIIFSTT